MVLTLNSIVNSACFGRRTELCVPRPRLFSSRRMIFLSRSIACKSIMIYEWENIANVDSLCLPTLYFARIEFHYSFISLNQKKKERERRTCPLSLWHSDVTWTIRGNRLQNRWPWLISPSSNSLLFLTCVQQDLILFMLCGRKTTSWRRHGVFCNRFDIKNEILICALPRWENLTISWLRSLFASEAGKVLWGYF